MNRGWQLLIRATQVLCSICFVATIVGGRTASADEDAPAAAPRPVLILRSNLPGETKGWAGDFLTRELPRQAVLSVAREELRLNTRDATLREPTTASPGTVLHEFDIQTTAYNGVLDINLKVQRADQSESVWEKTFDLGTDYNIQFLRLIGELEGSRTEIRAALEKAGVTLGPAQPAGSSVPITDLSSLERQITDLSLTAQFGCLRKAHALVRAKGESPELLSVLARGYAQLSQLTFFHWTGAYSAFQARALLYTERLVATYPKLPQAFWTRAYVRAWTGFHAGALADLEAGQQLQADKPDPQPPAWVALVRPTCEYRLRELAALGEKHSELRQQAAYLEFLTIEAAASPQVLAATASRALEAIPNCYRIRESLSERGPFSERHTSTVEAARHWQETFASEVAQLTDLPPSVLELTRRPAPAAGLLEGLFGRSQSGSFGPEPAKLAHALVEAAEPDTEELSWGVLGRLIEETNFALVARRFSFLRGLAHDAQQSFVQQAIAAVDQHPYRPWFEIYRFAWRTDQKRFRRVAGNMEVRDARPCMEPMLVDMLWLDPPGKPNARHNRNNASWYTSQAAYDLESRLEYIPEGVARDMSVRVLRNVSPHNPTGIADILGLDDVVDAAQLKAWEEQYSDFPDVARGLARRYNHADRNDEAERLLIRVVEQDPSEASHSAIADFYWAQGNEPKFLESLEAFLKQPETDLAHARTRVRLANYLMERGRYRQAEPFALAAAQSHSEWALKCAGCCCEGLGRMDEAENWWRSAATAYAGARTSWYFWCRRTGMGDVNAAYVLAKQRIDELENGPPSADRSLVGAFYVLTNDKPKALEVLQAAVAADPWPWNSLHLALVADELDDRQLRDQTLAKLVDASGELTAEGQKYAGQADLVRLAELLQKAYAATGDDEPSLDLESVDALIKKASPSGRADLGYFVGRFLSLHGEDDAATEYWRRASSIIGERLNVDLAGAELAARGIRSWRSEQRKD